MSTHNEFPRMAEVFLRLCESTNSPTSLGLWLRFKHDQKSLAEFEFDTRIYTNRSEFEADYQCFSFLSKWKGLNTGIDLESVAIQKFEASELQCKETNEFFRALRAGRVSSRHSGVLFTAKRKIAQLLGPFSLFKLCSGVGWGPGATDDVARRSAALDTKLLKVPFTVTRGCFPFALSHLYSDVHWSSALLGIPVEALNGPFSFMLHMFAFTETCVIELVPKNAKTHRVIAKEPRLNTFVQKGVGEYLRRQLKRVGIDLNDQSANQEGARRAFKEGLATLDLRAASDSVAMELVYELLPFDWASALDEIRSKQAILPDGRMVKLEKISSMGNGFTFELETLLFWALARSVTELYGNEEGVLVYGDDIILPAHCASALTEVLHLCGFEVNASKSFVTGNFFESCGMHFFEGVDVTPCYQKEHLDHFTQVIRCGNRLRRWSLRIYGSLLNRSPARTSWNYLYNYPTSCRDFQIPQGSEGDDGWVVDGGLFTATSQDPSLGLACRVYARANRRFPAADPFLLAWSLRRMDERPLRDVSINNAWEGFIEFPPSDTAPYEKRRRWVMPTGDFAYAFDE